MRRYRIVMTAPTTSSGSGTTTTAARQSLIVDSQTNGANNPGALEVEIDIPIKPLAQTVGGIVTIHGLAFSEITQAQKFQGGKIQVYAGMGAGLPLANPKQYGLICQGMIQQCFANFVGTDMALTAVIYPGPAMPTPSAKLNAVLDWKSGTTIGDAITATLAKAAPNASVTVNLQNNFTLGHDEQGYYPDLSSFASVISSISKQTVNQPNYVGAMMLVSGSSILVTDQPSKTTTAIAETDLIGQPAWVDNGVIQVQTVMRADLAVAGQITLPSVVAAGYGTISIPSSASPVPTSRSNAFGGQMMIRDMRHIGASRSADGAAWMTVLNVFPVGQTNAN